MSPALKIKLRQRLAAIAREVADIERLLDLSDGAARVVAKDKKKPKRAAKKAKRKTERKVVGKAAKRKTTAKRKPAKGGRSR